MLQRCQLPLSSSFGNKKSHTSDIVHGVYGTYGLDTLVRGHGFSVDRKIQVAPVGGNKCELAVATREARRWLRSNSYRSRKLTRK